MNISKKLSEFVSKSFWLFKIIFWILIVLFSVAIFIFIQRYTTQFQTIFSTEIQEQMSEIAQQVTLTMNDRMNANQKNAETLAVAVAEADWKDTTEIKEFLQQEVERYGFTNLLLANKDGSAISNSGQPVIVSRRKHYLRALEGTPSISEVTISDFSNTDSIELAVPIWQGGSIIGVLLADYSLEDFQNIVQVPIFGGRGNIMVIDAHGVVIINNGEKSPYNFNTWLRDNTTISTEEYTLFTEGMINREGVPLHYGDASHSYLSYYTPLNVNDWGLLVTTSTEQTEAKMQLFLQGMTNIGFSIAGVILFFMLAIIMAQTTSRKNLEKLLYVDEVTGGMSFAKLTQEAKKLFAKNNGENFTVVHMDMERFKLINTTFGRQEGDRTIRHIGSTIQGALDTGELSARVSADRFCLLLHYHTAEELSNRLEALSELINSFNKKAQDNYLLRFHFGVCLAKDDMTDISMLYEQAHFASTSKRVETAYGSISFYDEVERSSLLREKEIENHMAEALARGEFEVYLQPKYELKGNTIAGAEALIRWNDPKKGMVSPGEFIPLFERNGFIVNLDLYVFEEVCKFQQQQWAQGAPCVPISVNLSRKHLENTQFLQKYKDVFVRYVFPPKLLEIELTESLVFNNTQELCNIIDEIHAIGFECSMDDFGSGYSSLNMLKDIPVDTLKLDRTFFYSTNDDESKSRSVVGSVLDLAGRLQMKTVAEGIESIDQVNYLREEGCDMVQGFVFAKPMPITKFLDLIEKEITHEKTHY